MVWAEAPLPPPPPPVPTLEEKILAGDTSTTTIRAYIEEQAELMGVDPKLASAITKCESGWDYLAENPRSSADSTFQFIDGTWRRTMERMGYPTWMNKFDPILGVQAGIWLLAEDGVGHWLESRPCWSKSYPLDLRATR